MVAYCTADDVNEILGGSLEPAALDAAAGVVDGVSALIDLITEQRWVSGSIAAEVQTVTAGQIRLDHPPVSAIATVTVTDPYIGAVPVVLVEGVGYQLVDSSEGLVLVSAIDGARATVSYTASPGTVPAYINLAAKIASAHCIRYAIDPTGFTLTKLESGTAHLTYTGGGALGSGNGSGGGFGSGLPELLESLMGQTRSSWVFA